jgi:deazaflavin-dependent oxidoreductase (nitroreductase family)
VTANTQNGQALFLYLTTRGRRSGQPREIEIWYTHHDGRYYVIAEHAESDWVKNILADPAVSFRIGEASFAGQARVVEAHADPKLNQAVQRLSQEKYGWGDGLVVELTPQDST